MRKAHIGTKYNLFRGNIRINRMFGTEAPTKTITKYEGIEDLMNIEYFREFIELTQCLNFTVAANNLNITQPALSKHILALEKEFGVELFDRSRKGIQLTEAGRTLFESAGLIVNTYDETKSLLSVLKEKHPVRIAGHMEDSDIASLVSSSAMLARERYHVTTLFDRNSETDPFALLESNDVDLYIGYTNPEKAEVEGFAYRPFISNRLAAVVGTYHQFADRQSIRWDDLKNETFVKFISDKTNPAWEQIEGICQAHGFTPKTRAVSSLNDVEYFSTPLRGSVLIWKKTQKQIGLLLETGHRACIPISDDDAFLKAYAVYKPENEEHLQEFFMAADEARKLLENRKTRNAASAD